MRNPVFRGFQKIQYQKKWLWTNMLQLKSGSKSQSIILHSEIFTLYFPSSMTQAHCTHTYVLQYFCKPSRRRFLLLNCSERLLGPQIRIWAFFHSSFDVGHRVITCIYFAARLQMMTCAGIELHSWAGMNPPSAPACFGHSLSTKRSQ